MKFNITAEIWLLENRPAFRRLVFIELSMLLMVLAATALVIFGSCRRRRSQTVLNGGLWISYSLVTAFLFANTIGQMQGADFRNDLFILWGMILIILVGCSDSFSSYSPADNEQWRYFHFQLNLQNVFVGLMVGLYVPAPTVAYNIWVRVVILFIISCFTNYKAGERIQALEMATKSSLAKNTKYIADFMSREHEIHGDGEPDPAQMKGYNYLVSGDTDLGTPILPNYEQLVDVTKDEVVTVHKIWQFQGGVLTGETGEQLKDICLSFALYKLLCRRFGGHPFLESSHVKTWRLVRDGLLSREGDYKRAFRVIEVELCFLFDLFYTKYAVIFRGGQGLTKWKLYDAVFVILACVVVLRAVKNYQPSKSDFYLITAGGKVIVDKVATVFTVFLILLMEIAQTLLLFVSDWATVLWICSYVKGNSWLHDNDNYLMLWTKLIMFCQKQFKPWERKLGQYFLLESFHLDPWRFKYSSFYACLTCMSVYVPRQGQKGETRIKLPEEVKKAVLLTLRSNGPNLRNGEESLHRNEVWDELFWACRLETPTQVILVWHVATSLCTIGSRPMRLSNENFIIASALSGYCAYLVTFAPRLICTNATVSMFIFDQVIQETRDVLLSGDLDNDIYRKLMNQPNRGGDRIIQRGASLANDLQQIQNDERDFLWKVLADFWAEYMLFLSPCGDPMAHVEHLAKGGEFVTHLWALLSHAGILNNGSTVQDL